jgi:hypothetical protein
MEYSTVTEESGIAPFKAQIKRLKQAHISQVESSFVLKDAFIPNTVLECRLRLPQSHLTL